MWDAERYRMDCLTYWFLRCDPCSSSQYNCIYESVQSYKNLSKTQDRWADSKSGRLWNAWVWVLALSLTSCEIFEQFTSLDLNLLTCKMNTVPVTESKWIQTFIQSAFIECLPHAWCYACISWCSLHISSVVWCHPFYREEKLRLRELKQVAQSHTV